MHFTSRRQSRTPYSLRANKSSDFPKPQDRWLLHVSDQRPCICLIMKELFLFSAQHLVNAFGSVFAVAHGEDDCGTATNNVAAGEEGGDA